MSNPAYIGESPDKSEAVGGPSGEFFSPSEGTVMWNGLKSYIRSEGNMKRSEINAVVMEARESFERHGWSLPPNPRWDVTDFGLGDFNKVGLTLVNLAEQPEYCEKLMYVRHAQVTPRHYHASKKEDIICRWGRLVIELPSTSPVRLQVNGEWRDIQPGKPLLLSSGERVTLTKGVLHAFWADSGYAILGEVSTANDDANDNYFEDKRVGRFSNIDEDAPATVKLVSD